MKKVIKKNQIIISTLAVLIAIAGYVRCSGSLESKNEEYYDVMEEVTADNLEANSLEDVINTVSEGESDIAINDVDPDPNEIQYIEPGSAVLTSAGSSIVSAIKLEREQTRAKNKETLLSIINNTEITEQQKSAAIEQMLNITDISERENATETMLKSQGYYNTIVSISDDKVDIVIDMSYVNDDNIVQIEDIVKRKASVSADKITIIPMEEKEAEITTESTSQSESVTE